MIDDNSIVNESETEQERKVREYWANAYKSHNSIYDITTLNLNNDNDNDSNGAKLLYEPTAVLTSRNNSSRKISIYDILGLDLRNE